MATGGTVVSVLQSPMDGCQALFNFKATLSTRRTPVALRFGESRTPLQMCWTVRCRKRRPYSIAQLGVGVANLWEALTVHTAACVVVSAAALVSVVFLRCLRMSRAVVRPRWAGQPRQRGRPGACDLRLTLLVTLALPRFEPD
jgi:hypothetical protein